MPDMPDFSALFNADLEPERVPFSVQGHECWVDLRPMDAQTADGFAVYGVKYVATEQGLQEITDVDQAGRNVYLVRNTVVDFLIWRPAKTVNSDGEVAWQEHSGKGGADWLVKQRATSPFWDWLVGECARVNGQRETDVGNSPDSSGN